MIACKCQCAGELIRAAAFWLWSLSWGVQDNQSMDSLNKYILKLQAYAFNLDAKNHCFWNHTYDTPRAKFISVPAVSSISPEGNGDPDMREVCLPMCL